MVYIRDRFGKPVHIDFFEVIGEDGKIGYYVNNAYHRTKVHFRPERTWDDHMGNTPCGYYTVVSIPHAHWNPYGELDIRYERRRVYIHHKGWQ